MVATFNVQALEYLKKHHPDIRRIRHIQWYGEKGGFRVKDSARIWKKKEDAMSHILQESKELGLYGMNIPVEKTTPEDIAFFRKGGVKWLSLFFVQTAETAARVSSWDVDAFVTDHVSEARAGFAQGNKQCDAASYGDMQNKDR
jgi:glycerophosphoryl diester phosphodiesterase